MTQQLCKGLLPSPIAFPSSSASQICFSPPGALKVCTEAGQERKIQEGEKIVGLRKRKGSQALLWLISPHSGKSLLPSPSQSSLPPHESQRRLLLLSNLEK